MTRKISNRMKHFSFVVFFRSIKSILFVKYLRTKQEIKKTETFSIHILRMIDMNMCIVFFLSFWFNLTNKTKLIKKKDVDHVVTSQVLFFFPSRLNIQSLCEAKMTVSKWAICHDNSSYYNTYQDQLVTTFHISSVCNQCSK